MKTDNSNPSETMSRDEEIEMCRHRLSDLEEQIKDAYANLIMLARVEETEGDTQEWKDANETALEDIETLKYAKHLLEIRLSLLINKK